MRLVRRLFALLIVVGTVAGNAQIDALRAWAQGLTGPQPAVTLQPGGIVVEWHAPPAQVSVQSGGTSRIEIAGYARTAWPGSPELPFSAVLVTLPPGAKPTLELDQVDEIETALPAPVGLAEQPQGVQRAPDGQVIGGAFASVTTDAVVAQANRASYPLATAPVALEPLGVLRGVKIARLVFYPARPVGGNLHLTRRVRAILHFNSPNNAAPQPDTASTNPLLAALKPLLINPQQLQPGLMGSSGVLPSQVGVEGLAAAIEIDSTGLVGISYEDLAAAGFPLDSVNPANLHLSRAGVEVPREWEGDADEVFEPGERLLFFAEPRFSRWSVSDVYFLQPGNDPGLVMASRAADPSGLPSGAAWIETTVERNLIYTPSCYCAPIPAGRDGDRWIWDNLQLPGRPVGAYAFDLDNVDGAQTGSLDLWLIGFTDLSADPDHRVEVTLNDVPIGTVQWDGKQAVLANFTVPQGILHSGSNILELSLPGLPGVSVEGAWLDAFSVRFKLGSEASGDSILFTGEQSQRSYAVRLLSTEGLRAYEVTGSENPQRLTGLDVLPDGTAQIGDSGPQGEKRYWVANQNGILSPARVRVISPLLTGEIPGADYLVIAPDAFFPALEDLVALRQGQGLQVAVENVQAIYDAFGDGRPDPAAIKAFLAHAYTAWNPRPVYVLLAGDGTSDPRHYYPETPPDWIPAYLAEVDPWAGETASDNRYVTLDGDDNLPDMMVGRLPVNSPEEAKAVVDKIVNYEANPASGSWNRTSVFLADDQDGGGNFPALSDDIVSTYFSPPRVAYRLYLTPPYNTAEEIQQDLLDLWNQGTGLVMFTGHSSFRQWAVERFFHSEDVVKITNGTKLPVVLEMTCFTGSFHHVGTPTMDEALLNDPQDGAVAVWGPTGLGISTGHAALAEGFMRNIFWEGQAELGRATIAGKIHLLETSPAHDDLIDTFTLFGDPATRFNLEILQYPNFLPLTHN